MVNLYSEMILNNKFYIDNLKNVVFLGETEVFEELIEINDTFGVKTLVVTSSHQARAIEKNIKKNIFDSP